MFVIALNEIMLDYTEAYFNTVRALQIKVWEKYFDFDTRIEFINTQITLNVGLVCRLSHSITQQWYSNGKTGNEEKSPRHITDNKRN